jgi:hypothetical protein
MTNVQRMPVEDLPPPFSLATRERYLLTAEVRELLRSGPVQFVVADVGCPWRIVPLSECFEFWKSEAKARIAGNDRIFLDDFPDGLAYLASLWGDGARRPIVLLESFH